VHFAEMPLKQMLHYLQFENNPPLYFILLHFWMKLFGSGELAVRALSMIFGMASIPMVYVLGVRLFTPLAQTPSPDLASAQSPSPQGRGQGEGRVAGLFAAFLLAISTFQVYYATETRMYTLYLFLALLAVWLFVRLQIKDLRLKTAYQANPSLSDKGAHHSVTKFVPLFLVLLLLIWTHITAWMIIAALLIYLLWQSQFNIKQFIIHNSRFIILGALLVLQFLPWAVNFIKLKIITPISQGYFFYLPPDKNFFLSILEMFLVFGQDNAFIVTLLSVVIVGLLWFALRSAFTPTPLPEGEGRVRGVRLLFSWLLVPLLIGFAFSNAIPRYFIAVAPALYLLLGIGFANFVERIKGKFTLRQFYLLHTTFYLLMLALIFPDLPSLVKIGHREWDKLTGWVEQMQNVKCKIKNECLVLINPHSEILPFERYYKGSLPVVGFYPRDDQDDRDTRIVKTNWISLNTKENVPRLRDITRGYNHVFLVTGGIDPIGRNLVPAWFWDNGWKRVESQEFGRISVMVLERLPLTQPSP